MSAITAICDAARSPARPRASSSHSLLRRDTVWRLFAVKWNDYTRELREDIRDDEVTDNGIGLQQLLSMRITAKWRAAMSQKARRNTALKDTEMDVGQQLYAASTRRRFERAALWWSRRHAASRREWCAVAAACLLRRCLFTVYGYAAPHGRTPARHATPGGAFEFLCCSVSKVTLITIDSPYPILIRPIRSDDDPVRRPSDHDPAIHAHRLSTILIIPILLIDRLSHHPEYHPDHHLIIIATPLLRQEQHIIRWLLVVNVYSILRICQPCHAITFIAAIIIFMPPRSSITLRNLLDTSPYATY